MSSSTVPVPRAALLVLLALAALGLVAVGFALGRHPSPPAAAPPPAAVAQPSLEPLPTAPAPVAQPSFEPLPTASAAAPAPLASAPSPEPAATAEQAKGSPVAPVDPALRQQVADYLASLDESLAVARNWDDPRALAQALVTQASQGDPRGMEQVLAANRRALEAARKLAPPAPCKEYHEDALEVLSDGNRLVAELGAATLTGDTFELGRDLAPAAQELREEVLELRDRRAELLHRFGLDRPGPAR